MSLLYFLRGQDKLSAAEGDNADQPRSAPELEEVPKPEDNVPSDAELNDQSTQEGHLHPECNLPVIPNAPSYGFGLMPASAGHLSQFDGPEAWAHDVSRLANFAVSTSSYLLSYFLISPYKLLNFGSKHLLSWLRTMLLELLILLEILVSDTWIWGYYEGSSKYMQKLRKPYEHLHLSPNIIGL